MILMLGRVFVGSLEKWACVDLEVIDEDQRLVEFIDANGGWNRGMLERYLPKEICAAVLRVLPPNSCRGADTVRWKHSSDGVFSVKSAYNLLVWKGPVCKASIWKRIWHWPGPQRIRTFLWLLAKGRLLTNVQRVARKMVSSGVCSRCVGEKETCLHALRDCALIKNVWKRIVHPSKWRLFFSLNLENWVERNLSEEWGKSDSYNWKVIFGVACWWLWKVRNEVVFCEDVRVGRDPFLSIFLKANEIMNAEAGVEKLWVKKNKYELGGFSKFLGPGSVTKAEIWGIILGAKLAWEKGFRRVWFESDSRVVVDLILNGCDAQHPLAGFVKIARCLLDRSWQVRVSHIFREGNQVADCIAGCALRSRSSIDFMCNFPKNCGLLLLGDAFGTLVPRVVAV
ncbi:Ribonuclease H protein [Senna tora]|uniref:Ribonuclease H protein n=1 Tax=Senna tora TaxID=362788 RepID=A0A834X7L4_9FABA|nr:Ribonuclease H protein [Senna tora]